jgi:hypothetical protein
MGTRSDVQALSSVASLEGDENSCLAEAGSRCVVVLLGNVPYIVGFFIPKQVNNAPAGATRNIDTGAGNEGAVPGSAAGNRGTADVGDQVFGTRGKNRLVLRRSGIIEIEASKMCRRLMVPDKGQFIDQCKNYQFAADGMITVSKVIPDAASTDQTYYGTIYKDNIQPENLITIERGRVSPDDDTLMEKYAVGSSNVNALSMEKPTYVRFRKTTGEFKEAVNPGGSGDPEPDDAAWYRGVDAEGNYEETINAKTYTLAISADGNIERETAGTLDDIIKGDVAALYEKNFQLSVKGDAKYTYSKDVTEQHGSKRKMTGQGTEYIEMASGKLAMGNSAVDLVDIVYQLCSILSKTLTPGYNGPLSTMGEFMQLTTKMAGLKK